MEGNNSITKEMIDYYDYGNINIETRFIFLAMSHIELLLTAATAQTRPSKVCLWQVWKVSSGGN